MRDFVSVYVYNFGCPSNTLLNETAPRAFESTATSYRMNNE